MKKVIKIIIAILLTVAILFGSVAGLKIIRKKNAKKVQVYSVQEVEVDPSYFFEDSMSYGEISSDKVQSVFVSESQNVKEVLVQQGQKVKKGDVLLTYDSTLTSLQLERAENDLRQEEYNLRKAQEELEILNQLVPVSDSSEDSDGDYTGYDDNYDDFTDDFDEEPDDINDLEPIEDTADDEMGSDNDEKDNENKDEDEDKEYDPQETGVLLYGNGTADEPYVYLWDSADTLTDERMLAMFAPHISTTTNDYNTNNVTDDSVNDQYDYDSENDGQDIDTSDDGQYIEPSSHMDELIETQTNSDDEFIPDEPVNTETNDEFIPDEEIRDTASEEVSGAFDSLDVQFADEEIKEEIPDRTEDDTELEFGSNSEDSNEVNQDTDRDTENTTDNEDMENEDPSTDDFVFNEENHTNETPIDNSDIYEAIEQVEFGTENNSNTNPNEKPNQNTKPQNEQQNTVPEYLNNAPTDLYVVLEIHKDNNMDAPLIQSFGLHLLRDGTKVMIQLFNPNSDEDNENDEDEEDNDGEEQDEAGNEEDGADEETMSDSDADLMDGDEAGDEFDDSYDDYSDDYYDESYDESYDDSSNENEENEYANLRVNPNGQYTAKEIEELRKEIERDIRDLDISVKKAGIALMEQQNEYDSNVVKSKIDGVVKTVRDPSEDKSEAIMVITGGGGYTVTVNIGELDMMNIKNGQEVKVSSVTNEDESYPGYVQEIGNYPTSNDDSFGSGNPFVSYYPCKIQIDENAEFREGDYLGVSFDTGKGKKGLYIESMFVRSDSKGKYVYVRGENDKLERRNIRTGKSPDQYTVEVRGGLSRKDYIAFPYGTNVFEGAETEEATIDELYS